MPSHIAPYGAKPGQSTGNYQRHLDSVLGFGTVAKEFYKMTVPGNTKDGLFQRMPLEIPLRPPHELMEEEIKADCVLIKEGSSSNNS